MGKRLLDSDLMRSLFAFSMLTALTGVAFPSVLLLLSEGLFPASAHGSLMQRDGVLVGSTWIGQSFDSPRYFWSRPSATTPYAYNAAASAGSNLGPLHPDLLKVPKARLSALGGEANQVPIDLLTTSGSGLDPHISVDGALYQVERVARSRGLPSESVQRLVELHSEPRTWGFLGEPRVNVLSLNLALDELR